MLTIPSTHIRIGDTARFPLGKLGDDDVYRHRWEVYAFVRDGVIVRRLADGFTRTVSYVWYSHYRTDDSIRPTIADDAFEDRQNRRRAGLERIRAHRVADVRKQTDPTLPGFYVSAISRGRYALLLGPFADHYDALQLVQFGRCLAQPFDQWNEYAYGTCRVETSERQGRFNDRMASA